MKIIWLPGAIFDLKRLKEFLATLDKGAAQKAVVTIKRSVALLEQYDSLGKPVADLPDFRDVIIPFGSAGYVLRYRIRNEVVVIVAVRHAKEAGFVTLK